MKKLRVVTQLKNRLIKKKNCQNKWNKPIRKEKKPKDTNIETYFF